MNLTNAVLLYLTLRYFYKEHYGDAEPCVFRDRLAYELMYNGILRDEQVVCPVVTSHTLVARSADKRNKAKQIMCRYCGMACSTYCTQCSSDGNWVGICNNAVRGCLAKHKDGTPAPRRGQKEGGSEASKAKRARTNACKK